MLFLFEHFTWLGSFSPCLCGGGGGGNFTLFFGTAGAKNKLGKGEGGGINVTNIDKIKRGYDFMAFENHDFITF